MTKDILDYPVIPVSRRSVEEGVEVWMDLHQATTEQELRAEFLRRRSAALARAMAAWPGRPLAYHEVWPQTLRTVVDGSPGATGGSAYGYFAPLYDDS